MDHSVSIDSSITLTIVYKSLQHLLILSIDSGAYEGLGLYFQDGGIQRLKELYVGFSMELRYIIIDEGALPYLKKLQLGSIPRLENVPTGIQHIEKLEVLHIWLMPIESVQRIYTEY